MDLLRRAGPRLRAGLDIHVPILLACSTNTHRGSRHRDTAGAADAVLDVAHMVRWAPRLGRHVTLLRVASGLHDLTLSPAPVRAELFTEMDRWIAARAGHTQTGAAGRA